MSTSKEQIGNAGISKDLRKRIKTCLDSMSKLVELSIEDPTNYPMQSIFNDATVLAGLAAKAVIKDPAV